MPPEFIYFDLGNVLLNFDRQQQYRQLADVAGVSLDVACQAVEGPVNNAVESGQMSTQDLYEHFCQATGSRPEPAAVKQAWDDFFYLNVPILPLLVQLRRAGHRMGILSNTSESHWQFVTDGRYSLLSHYFEIAILSYEVGVMKPEAKIYEAAIEAVGIAPEKIFFMDDREENVTGAIECGIDAVVFRDTPTLVADLAERGVEFTI